MSYLPQALGPEPTFPDPREAPRTGRYAGCVAVGGDLSMPRLLAAYRRGIFPWTDTPITWWSPDPRGVIELDQLHVPRSFGRVLRSGRFRVTVNAAFPDVIRGCARSAPGREETWISPAFVAAYVQLHLAGHAHSVECWLGDELAGGIYGVATGGLFAGESMFHRVSEASKVALVALARRLHAQGYALFDIQMVTPVTSQFGAREIPREEYLRRLEAALLRDCRFDPASPGGETAEAPTQAPGREARSVEPEGTSGQGR
jgi:leucyl/phenylalanyl-tRNA--protein transferase